MKSKISEAIVLFTDLKTGFVVHESDGDYGYDSNKWAMGVFEDFNGKVILSNK